MKSSADTYDDDGGDDVNRTGSLFERFAKPRKQIGTCSWHRG